MSQCRSCGLSHSPLIRCEQAAAINTAVSINKPGAAINAINAVSPISANGRKREKYNEYMRGYMRKRRMTFAG